MQTSAKAEWEAIGAAAHVWHVCPDALTGTRLRRCLAWLSGAEKAHREKLRTARLRHEYLAARALCRATLSRYTGIEPEAWRFSKNAHGKPAIAGPARFRPLRFNLTHTAGLVACIVTRAGEVGIDAEETGRAVDVAEVARHFFSEEERKRLAALSARRRTARFFEYWVLKEAYLKGRGVGLSVAPDGFTIELRRGRALPIGSWALALYQPTRRHVAATAVRVRRGVDAVPIVWRAWTELV